MKSMLMNDHNVEGRAPSRPCFRLGHDRAWPSIGLFCGLILFALTAQAGVGDTVQQVDAAYGPALVKQTATSLTHEYRHAGYPVRCQFTVKDEGSIKAGTCLSEEIDFGDEQNKAALKKFLDLNRGKSKWEEVPQQFVFHKWRTADGTRKATFGEIRVNGQKHFLLTLTLCVEDTAPKSPARSPKR